MMKKENQKFIIILVSMICVIAIFRFILFPTYNVSGSSMAPTFHDKDQLIVNHAFKHHYDTKDVVIFEQSKHNHYIKRIIGTPYDKVSYKNDQLYINHKEVKEPYLDKNKNLSNKSNQLLTDNFKSSDVKGSHHKMTIPAHKYLVLGDNRHNSQDSRYNEVGLVDASQIKGKVEFRFWPINHLKHDFNH